MVGQLKFLNQEVVKPLYMAGSYFFGIQHCRIFAYVYLKTIYYSPSEANRRNNHSLARSSGDAWYYCYQHAWQHPFTARQARRGHRDKTVRRHTPVRCSTEPSRPYVYNLRNLQTTKLRAASTSLPSMRIITSYIRLGSKLTTPIRGGRESGVPELALASGWLASGRDRA